MDGSLWYTDNSRDGLTHRATTEAPAGVGAAEAEDLARCLAALPALAKP